MFDRSIRSPDLATSGLALALLVAAALAGWGGLTAKAPSPGPLPRLAIPMHSHNDYDQPYPLDIALNAGARSIEVDVFPGNDDLYVAHDFEDIDPARTFSSLYGVPLALRLDRTGAIYPDQPLDEPVILLVDFKGDPDRSYDLLYDLTRPLAPYLARFNAQGRLEGRLLVVISGNTPRSTIEADTDRDLFADGRLHDLTPSGFDATIAPLVSSRWSTTFSWDGVGEFPREQRATLNTLIAQAHARGQAIRFWATPDQENAWTVLHDARVDLINTDRPGDVADFFHARRAAGEGP